MLLKHFVWSALKISRLTNPLQNLEPGDTLNIYLDLVRDLRSFFRLIGWQRALTCTFLEENQITQVYPHCTLPVYGKKAIRNSV